MTSGAKGRSTMAPQDARNAPAVDQLAEVTWRPVYGRDGYRGDAITAVRRAHDEIRFVLVTIALRFDRGHHFGTECAKARLTVGETQARNSARRRGGYEVRDAAMRRNRRQADLARTNHDVGEVERREQARSERRVVLAIRVERDDLTAWKVLGCMCERGAQRSAFATVGVEADDVIARTLEHRARGVERAVIHAEHEHGAHVPAHRRDD